MATTNASRPTAAASPRLRPLVAPIALLLLTAGCSSLPSRGQAPRATVTFVNESLDQASVYAIGMSGESYRVGTVAGGRTEQLRLPAGLVASSLTLRFVARPLATRRVATSGPVTIGPGDSYTITLPPEQNILSILPGRP